MSTAAPLETRLSPGTLMPLGRAFVSRVFDLMLIGGGLSIVTVLALQATGHLGRGKVPQDTVLVILLLANSSHFAASTVRLYTKPGAFQTLPAMTMVFPLLAVAAVTVGLFAPDLVGRNLYVLYMSWSPYHYAAQTYGLAVMYAARSGCQLEAGERRLLWATCMLPFLYAFVGADTTGLGWVLTPTFFADHLQALALRGRLHDALGVLVFAVPALLLVQVYRRARVGLPLISVLLIVSNGLWWVWLPYVDAFVWATVFHGVQYLAIVVIFHVRDHPGAGAGTARWLMPAVKFYGMCVLLAYLLFEVWPYAYVMAGFTFAESALLCIAVINIHHFIVDRGIWRQRSDPNYRIVVGA